MTLRIIVLGAGAGGRFPRWDCNCTNCRRARSGDPAAAALTQSSPAVSADSGTSWYLLNASPDLRQQIAQTPARYPQTCLRRSPIAGVILTNADVDPVAGLLTMREMQPFGVYGTPRVLGVLRSRSIFTVLGPDLVTWRPLTPDRAIEIPQRNGRHRPLRDARCAAQGRRPHQQL
jgi:pyrroloquinoline quinone biosynthesis protein B